MRSLFSYVRVLPAFRMYRACKVRHFLSSDCMHAASIVIHSSLDLIIRHPKENCALAEEPGQHFQPTVPHQQGAADGGRALQPLPARCCTAAAL